MKDYLEVQPLRLDLSHLAFPMNMKVQRADQRVRLLHLALQQKNLAYSVIYETVPSVDVSKASSAI